MSTNLTEPQSREIVPPPFWTHDVEEFLAENTEFTALPFTLQLLSQAQAALFFLDAQAIYAEYGDGTINSKFVSTEGVRSAFFYESLDSGWMPPHIKRWGQTTKGRWAVQFAPQQRYELELPHAHDSAEHQPTRLAVTLPSIVFMGYKREYFVWAVEGVEFDPHAQIYHLPVPNIYGEGRICFGGNTPPEVTRPDLDAAWDLFKRSPYTCAHASERSRRFPSHVCTALYEHVADCGDDTPYPIEDLFPYYMSVDDAVRKITTGEPMPVRAREFGPGMIMHSFTEEDRTADLINEELDEDELAQVEEEEFHEA